MTAQALSDETGVGVEFESLLQERNFGRLRGQRFIDLETHLSSWYAQRERSNILVLHYEDMQRDLAATVARVAHFLDQPLTNEEIERIAELSTFSSMKKDHRTSMQLWDEEQRKPGMPFMRKGKAGDWTNHFTPDLTQVFDREFKVKMATSNCPGNHGNNPKG